MILVPFLLGAALFFYSAEMWARHRAYPSRAQSSEWEDSTVFVDRFSIADSGIAVPAVDRYLAFVAVSGSQGGLIHNYINQGSRRLVLALRGVSELNLRVRPVEKMESALGHYVDSLEAHPRWSLDPRRVRTAFLMSVEILESMNVEYDSAAKADIEATRKAAMDLDVGVSTLSQRLKAQEFFIRAGRALVSVKARVRLVGGK